ncbi:uncharacterized protein ISCGN_004740 [Ixodes scapularis]
MVLSNSIMREAKLRPQEADIKIRVNEQQNILVASTPYQSTASALSKIQKLTIGETTYAIASYGISPDNSCRGVIHSREKEATNEELLEAISAPGYEPLTCRRFGDSDTILITFIGKKVPFLIYVGGVETRCFLYKRTVAYCYVCHQTGHRADVCPYPPDVPTCKDCEALLTAEPHECKPKCSLCSGEHRTASKACPGRFLPPVNRRKEQTSIGRRRPRTPSGQRGDPSSRSSAARSRSRSYPRLTQDRRRRSSRSRSRSKTRGRTPSTQERIETQQSTQAIHKAGGQPLLIMGDFNAAHQLWGYAYSNKRGNALHALIANNDLTLLTNPASHTRMGNSVTNDTSPDLTITSHIPHADWEHLGEYLGSDHAILATTIYGAEYKVKVGKARLTDWTKLRDEREKRLKTTDHPPLTLQEWVSRLVQDVQTHTKNIETSTTTPCVDTRLLHLWEARRSLIKRWKKQKLNRKLKKRIARLTEDAAQYASELCKENWLSLCDGMCDTLSTYKTWKLLRYLIDPAKSKTTSQHTMDKVIHQHVGDTRHLLATLKTRYLPTHPTEPLPPYSGSPNPLLDEDIHLHEVTDALAKIRRNTAPGLDKVTNKALANLDNPSLLELTDHLNDIWQTGILPEDWKTAEVKLIPKPNKPPSTDNLRPISLTSCAGKLLEHIVLNRLQSYLEDHDKLPVTMFGFRSHLSTQDVLLQLKEEVMLPATRNSPTAILALDLKGAFDNVKHTAILSQLNTLDCGHRTYQYIKDFLSGRRAILKVGDLATDPVLLGSRGTPQGAVLSPLIFTIAVIGLPALLDSIPGVHHGIYADDITIWSGTGSFGEIEERLQTAATAVSDYAKSCGLECAPQKSELLLVSPRKKGSLDPPNVTICMEGHIIVPSPHIKILGPDALQRGWS